MKTLGAAGVLTGAGARPVTESCPTFALVRSRLAARVRLMRANALTIQKMAFGFFGFLAKFSNFSFLATAFSMFAHTLIPKTNFLVTLITIKLDRRSVCFFQSNRCGRPR